VKAAMLASHKLEAKEGTARLRKVADWLMAVRILQVAR